MNKLFIIGLPRTGTTSTCVALLDEGFKVAHTALSKHSFTLAEVIADTPCYCDFKQLDRLFPGSKFVYLDRPLSQWLPSITMLLHKIKSYTRNNGKLHPIINRAFKQTFALDQHEIPITEGHLRSCYIHHQQQVNKHFKDREDLLRIDISDSDSYYQLLTFIGKSQEDLKTFPHLNQGRMITQWKDIKHPNKVNSDAFGPERRQFFTYADKL